MDVNLIAGGRAEDARGCVAFVNDFDMTPVKRFYRVANSENNPFRGWIAHQREKKWFVSVSGRTTICLVKVDSFENASRALCVKQYVLDEVKPGVLMVPGGYAIGILSEAPGASVMVFSDCRLGEYENDVWRWKPDYWTLAR